MPEGLVGGAGQGLQLKDFAAEKGILLLWNAPDDPAGDTVTGYVIARKVKPAGGAWGAWDEAWYSITGKGDHYMRTYHTDTIEPDLDGGEERMYRVVAKSGAGTGPPTPAITYPHMGPTDGVSTPTTPSNVAPRVVTVGGIKTISVLWDSGEGEERQIVQLLTEDRMFVDSQTVGPDAVSADFDNDGAGVAPGTYRVQIVALGTGTDFRNSGSVLVEVE